MLWRFLNRNHQPGRVDLAFAMVLSAFAALVTPAPADSSSVTIAEGWGNLEAGTNAEFHAVIQSEAAIRGNLQWSVAVGPQPIVRREIEVTVEAGRPAAVPIQFTVPPLKSDVAVAALLTVAFQPQGPGQSKAVSSLEKTLWFFAANPFADHAASLKDKKIALFDPEEKTRKRFEQAGIPFALVPRLDAIANIREGLLIIGEGISLPDFRTLTDIWELGSALMGIRVSP